MLRTVHLYGSLREAFGASFQLDIASPVEAFQALGAMLPGFKAMIEAGHFKVKHGKLQGRGRYATAETLAMRTGSAELHITPAVAGAKSNKGAGIGKIIAGVLIAAVAFWAGAPTLAIMGLGLAVSGVSMLLTPKKKRERKTDFNSGTDVAEQGGCVTLAYGRCMISPKVIAAGVTSSDSNGYGVAVGTGQYVRSSSK